MSPAKKKSRWSNVSPRQVLALTKANLKSRYRKTFAGFIWVVMSPLISFGVQSLIFSHILQIEISRYFVFLMTGLLPWIFILQSLDMTVGIFVTSGRLLKSYAVHPFVYLLAQVLDNVLNFVIGFIILIVVCMVKLDHPMQVLLFPIPVGLLLIATFAMAWLLATLNVFFRDIRYILSFGMSVLYFLTPIFYPTDLLPKELQWIHVINPMSYLIQPFRFLIYDFDGLLFLKSCAQSLVVGIVFFVLANFVWRKKRNELYFHI
jgi:lipopolysaccharide transport system permease protein